MQYYSTFLRSPRSTIFSERSRVIAVRWGLRPRIFARSQGVQQYCAYRKKVCGFNGSERGSRERGRCGYIKRATLGLRRSWPFINGSDIGLVHVDDVPHGSDVSTILPDCRSTVQGSVFEAQTAGSSLHFSPRRHRREVESGKMRCWSARVGLRVKRCPGRTPERRRRRWKDARRAAFSRSNLRRRPRQTRPRALVYDARGERQWAQILMRE